MRRHFIIFAEIGEGGTIETKRKEEEKESRRKRRTEWNRDSKAQGEGGQ